jgi:DNA-binding SARP family transcriptional activator
MIPVVWCAVPLSISLLGPLDIRVDGTPLDVDTRKASALLVYLAVERIDQPRDRLVDLLWTDSDVDRGRSSLRRTLSSLKGGLDDRWVHADRAFVRIDPDGIDLDTDTVARLVEPHRSHARGEVCATCIDDLRAAVELHRGPLLDGFTVRGAPEFELWVASRAEAVAQRLDTALGLLASAHAVGGDYVAAAAVTERRLDLDPIREDAYRDLMLYNAWSGDRSGAVDAYRRAVGALDSELGVPPLEETTELYEAILEEDLPRAPAPARTPEAPTEAPAIPFLGRTSELATAVTALDDPGAIVVVEGEAGAGVTRFLHEVTERLRARATPLLAVASEAERANPYGVVNQALFDVVGTDDRRAELERLPESVLAEASRIFPDLGTPPSESSPTRFMDALARLVATVPNPLLVIDDLDRSDPASLTVIAFLANRADRIGLRILAGISTEGATDAPPTVDEILGRATVVRLEPLSTDDIAPLAVEAGLAPDDLHDDTGGLPLFLVEAIRAAREGTTSASRQLADRLQTVGGVARQVYEVLAILGRASDHSTIASVAGRSPDEVDEAIDVLASGALAVEDQSGAVRYAHGLMANAARDRLTAARRRLLNRRAARALEARGEEPGRIARHHALAGDDTAAAEWHRVAGEAASASFAYQEALEHLDAALAAGHADRAAIHRMMADTALLAGRYERAVEEYEKALAAGESHHDQIEYRLGEIMRRLGRWDLAAAHYDRARDSAEDPELRAVVAADRAHVELRRSGHDDAASLVLTAIELAEASGSRRAMARSRNVAGLAAATPGERRTHLEAALALADDPIERIAVLNNLSRETDGDEAVGHATEGLDLATALGDRHLMAALGNTLADALHASGDTTASHAALTRAVELFAAMSTDAGNTWSPEVWFLSEW